MTTITAAPPAHSVRTSDPATWVDLHGDSLYRYALAQVRDAHLAEDLVQETLLAALQARQNFQGRCSERTWLISILKHKVTDHIRRASKTRTSDLAVGAADDPEELFSPSGPWKGHWRKDNRPAEWNASPDVVFEQEEFQRVLQQCLDALPPRLAQAFWMREVEEKNTDEICKVLDITPTNLWVMLHRARMQLRRSLDVKWFERA